VGLLGVGKVLTNSKLLRVHKISARSAQAANPRFWVLGGFLLISFDFVFCCKIIGFGDNF
jgi:hypothetical protein